MSVENNKMSFANTINEMGSFGVKGASECHNFGSTWGCRPDCPVFERGECKDAYKENLKLFVEDDIIGFNDIQEFESALNNYADRLTKEEITELKTIADKCLTP